MSQPTERQDTASAISRESNEDEETILEAIEREFEEFDEQFNQ